MFDVRSYLKDRKIEFVSSGPNVPKNSVSIRCLFCEDPSSHLAISLSHEFYYCWRCGKSGNFISLIRNIDGVSWEEAKEVINGDTIVLASILENVDDISKVKSILSPKRRVIPSQGAMVSPLPSEAIKIETGKEWKLLSQFLDERKISIDVAHKYNLHFCKTGYYGNRLIIPICDEDGTYISFGARAMSKEVMPKYFYPKGWRTGNVLFGVNTIDGNGVLVLVEGLFDAMRLDGMAVACFTHRISSRQIVKLYNLYNEGAFKDLVVAFDGDSYNLSKQTGERLNSFLPSVRWIRLPQDQDPDSIGRGGILELIEKCSEFSV